MPSTGFLVTAIAGQTLLEIQQALKKIIINVTINDSVVIVFSGFSLNYREIMLSRSTVTFNVGCAFYCQWLNKLVSHHCMSM